MEAGHLPIGGVKNENPRPVCAGGGFENRRVVLLSLSCLSFSAPRRRARYDDTYRPYDAKENEPRKRRHRHDGEARNDERWIKR
jgi:hypothetical protein